MSKKHKKQRKHDEISTADDGAGGTTARTPTSESPSDRSLSRGE